MSAFNPRIFTNPGRLKEISPKNLTAFFTPWQAYFLTRGLDLSSASLADLPYDEIAHILLNPDDSVPEGMVDALYYVHETTNTEAMEDLLECAEKNWLAFNADPEVTVADIAVQIWLVKPELLQRHHAETVAFTRTSFMYFSGSSAKDASGSLPKIPEAGFKAMQKTMDIWFEKHRRGRDCSIFAFPRGKKVWLLVRHGTPMRREGKHEEGGGSGIAFYRPQKHDVLIYDGETDEIGVNADTKGERELYLATFGAALFGSETYFDPSERYTLEPLRDAGPKSMACDDIEDIKGVRLVEFGRIWPGTVPEREIRKGDDLFKAYGENWNLRLGKGSFTHATFKFAFEGTKRERSVTIRPANIARYERESDEATIETWLKARGFWNIQAKDAEDADFEVLDCA
jgi:hypothetical protein